MNSVIAVVHKCEQYLSPLKRPGNNDRIRASAGNLYTSLIFVHDTIGKAIHEAETQLTVLKQHNSSCAISLSIVRSIPSEILLHIFAFVHVDKPYVGLYEERRRWDGRIVVGRVCRKWRELVNGHPALWRDIIFPPYYFCQDTQAEDMLTYLLSRVRYGHINVIVPMYDRKSLLGKLFLSWAPRVARLKIEDHFRSRVRGSWLFHLPKTLPLLRSVELTTHYNETLLNKITAFAHAPLLQTFTIILFDDDDYRRPNPSIPLPYANLVEFNFAWYFDCVSKINDCSELFLRPLYEGKRLKTYRQWGCDLGYKPNVEVAQRRRRQGSLVKLVTSSSTILDSISCPLLEILVVGNVEGDGTYQVRNHGHIPDRTPRSARSLIESTASFLTASLCPLKSLELKSVTFNRNFITIINAIPSLETLNATATTFSPKEDDTLSEFFFLLREEDHGHFPFLPQLRSLSFTIDLIRRHPPLRRGPDVFHFANTSLFDAIIARSNVFQAFSLIIQAQEPSWELGHEMEMRLRELECVKELRCEYIYGSQGVKNLW